MFNISVTVFEKCRIELDNVFSIVLLRSRFDELMNYFVPAILQFPC